MEALRLNHADRGSEAARVYSRIDWLRRQLGRSRTGQLAFELSYALPLWHAANVLRPGLEKPLIINCSLGSKTFSFFFYLLLSFDSVLLQKFGSKNMFVLSERGGKLKCRERK